MIVRKTEYGLVLFRQTDHARLSGAFAAAWGSEAYPPVPNRESALVAATRHDDGWAEWELAPRVTNSGEVIDFLRIPVADHTELYRRGTDLVQDEDPYAGCIVSLHGKRLYTRPLEPDGPPRYTFLRPEDRPIAEAYVEREVARERRLLEQLSDTLGRPSKEVRADLNETWRVLQVWDRLSIFVCLQPLGSGTDLLLPPVRAADGSDVQLRMRSTSPGVVALDPYPFAAPEAEFAIEYLEVGAQTFDGDPSFRAAYRAARCAVLSFVAVPEASAQSV